MKYFFLIIISLATIFWSCKSTTTGPAGPAAQAVYFNPFPVSSGSNPIFFQHIRLDGSCRQPVLQALLTSSPQQGTFAIINFNTSDSAQQATVINTGSLNDSLTYVTFWQPPLPTGNFQFARTTLSPDGIHLASYANLNSGAADSGAIYVMDIYGANGYWAPTDCAFETEPAFSPDGSRIAYYGNDQKIHTMNVDGSNAGSFGNNIVPGNNFTAHIEWISNTTLMYTTIAGGVLDTYQSNIDGSNVIDFISRFPASWSLTQFPSSGLIAYSNGNICVAHADGSNVRTLVSEPNVKEAFPVWSPDGSKLLFTSFSSDTIFVNPGTLKVVDVATGAVTTIVDSVYRTGYWAR